MEEGEQERGRGEKKGKKMVIMRKDKDRRRRMRKDEVTIREESDGKEHLNLLCTGLLWTRG